MTHIFDASEVRKLHQACPALSESQSGSEYLKSLQQRGLWLNPKIYLATFQLANGLPYIGLATSEGLTGQTIIRVPEPMVLNTVKALKEPVLFDIYQDIFYSPENRQWEDRVLTTFCIFLLIQGDDSNPWFEMVKRFQRSCDLAEFWDQQLIESVHDPIFQVTVRRERREFQQEWEEFQSCRKRHELLISKHFDYENYRIMYANVWNRSFGKYVKYATMVPFADFINHHSSKVYYTFQSQSTALGSEQAVEDDQSSNGSFDSYNSDYDQPELQLQEYKANQIAQEIEPERLRNLEEYLVEHPQSLINYCQRKLHNSYYTAELLKNKDIEPSSQKQYNSFLLKASKRDYFPAHNQVYFRYGRDTNRNLLLDYGFAIEGNKYEYVSVLPARCSSALALSALTDKIAGSRVSLFRKFKIYRHLLNTDLIVYLRAAHKAHSHLDIFVVRNIDSELSVLERAVELLEEQMQRFDRHFDLSDKRLSFQQYFIQVYHHEKLLILKTQVAMLQKLACLLRAVQSGKSKEEACLSLTSSERKILGRYIDTIAV